MCNHRSSYLYSGDLKSNHSRTGNIWNQNLLKVRFQMVWFSNGWALTMTIAIVPTIWKPHQSKYRCFCLNIEWFLTKWRPFVLISDIIQNPEKFATLPLFHHSKSRLVRISDPHCSGDLKIKHVQFSNGTISFNCQMVWFWIASK